MSVERRGISLYIDGTEVKNNVRTISAEMRKIVNAQSLMTIGSREYVAAAQKIKSLDGMLKEHRENIGKMKTPLQKLTETAKGLLPAFSFAAIGAAAKVMFSKVVNITDTLSTKWAIFTGGLTEGTDYFFRTIATGDWSNFTTGMINAIEVGRKYQEMLDQIEEKTRAMSIAEADARKTELDLEIKLKNKTLSKEERKKAGDERIELEKFLAGKRVKVAQDAYDAEMMLASSRAKISKETLLKVMSDMDSEQKASAQEYNQKVERYNNLKNINVTTVTSNYGAAGTIQNEATEEMKKLRSEIDKYPASVKEYAASLTAVGNVTDEQLNIVVQKYTALQTARNSAVENIKKVITQVDTLKAGIDKEDDKQGDKKADENVKSATDVLEIAHKERVLVITQQYATEEQLKAEFHARMLAEEIAYLTTLAALEPDRSKQLDIQTQLATKQAEYLVVLKDATPAIMENSSVRQSLTATMLEEAKLLGIVAERTAQSGQISDDLSQKLINQAEVVQDTIGIVADGLFNMMSGSENAFQSFANNLIQFALQQLKLQTELAIAGVTIQSFAQPDSVMSFGATGFVRAALLVGLIEAAFAVAAGAVNGALTNKKSKGYAAGGFTDGTEYYAGEAGKEWIAPSWQLKDRRTAPMIAALEGIRQRPSGQMNVNPDLVNFVQSGSSVGSLPGTSKNDESLLSSSIAALNRNIEALANNQRTNSAIDNLNETLKKGINAKVAGYGGEGSVADAIKKIANLAKSLNL